MHNRFGQRAAPRHGWDKPVLASIGGAAFRQFKLTMDYVNQCVTLKESE